jgi:FixJ family two-component response regulator
LRVERGLSVDVVVTDVVMPEMGGQELVAQLRQRDLNHPVVYISGYTDDTSVVSELMESEVRLLEKPFSARALEIAVEEALEAVEPRALLGAEATRLT